MCPPKPEVTEPWGPGHISLVRFLLTVTKILGNEDRKPIKVCVWGGIKNCLEWLLYAITSVFANYCVNNTFNKAIGILKTILLRDIVPIYYMRITENFASAALRSISKARTFRMRD